MNDDSALAEAAVVMVAEHLKALGLTPYRFSSQIALRQLLDLADKDLASDVAQWILSVPREKLWKSDSAGMFVNGDEPIHILFQQAWQNFLLNELPEM